MPVQPIDISTKKVVNVFGGQPQGIPLDQVDPSKVKVLNRSVPQPQKTIRQEYGAPTITGGHIDPQTPEQEAIEKAQAQKAYKEHPIAQRFLNAMYQGHLETPAGAKIKETIPESETVGEVLTELGGAVIADIPALIAAGKLNPVKFLKYGKQLGKMGSFIASEAGFGATFGALKGENPLEHAALFVGLGLGGKAIVGGGARLLRAAGILKSVQKEAAKAVPNFNQGAFGDVMDTFYADGHESAIQKMLAYQGEGAIGNGEINLILTNFKRSATWAQAGPYGASRTEFVDLMKGKGYSEGFARKMHSAILAGRMTFDDAVNFASRKRLPSPVKQLPEPKIQVTPAGQALPPTYTAPVTKPITAKEILAREKKLKAVPKVKTEPKPKVETKPIDEVKSPAKKVAVARPKSEKGSRQDLRRLGGLTDESLKPYGISKSEESGVYRQVNAFTKTGGRKSVDDLATELHGQGKILTEGSETEGEALVRYIKENKPFESGTVKPESKMPAEEIAKAFEKEKELGAIGDNITENQFENLVRTGKDYDTIPVSKINIGDEFKLAGEKFTVKAKNADEFILEDGVKKTVDKIFDRVTIDRGSLRSVKGKAVVKPKLEAKVAEKGAQEAKGAKFPQQLVVAWKFPHSNIRVQDDVVTGKPGQTHSDVYAFMPPYSERVADLIIKGYEIKKGVAGFVDEKGRFLTREQMKKRTGTDDYGIYATEFVKKQAKKGIDATKPTVAARQVAKEKVRQAAKEGKEDLFTAAEKKRQTDVFKSGELNAEQVANLKTAVDPETSKTIKGITSDLLIENISKKQRSVAKAGLRKADIEKGLKDQELNDMVFAIEKTGNPYIEGDTYTALIGRLSPNARRKVGVIKNAFKEVRQMINDSEWGNNIAFHRNYITHLYTGQGLGRKAKDLAKTWSRRLPWESQRTYETYEQAIREAGLLPRFHKASDIVQYYENISNAILANRAFVKTARNTVLADGNKLIMRAHEAPSDYIKIDHWAFKDKFMVETASGGKVPASIDLTVHPGAYKYIRNTYTQGFLESPNAFIKGLRSVNAYLKFAKLTFSFFHHGALAESGIAGGRLNPIAAIQKGMKLMKDEKAYLDAVEHGLVIEAPEDVSRLLIDRHLQGLEQRLIKHGVARTFVKGLAKGKNAWDKLLWGYVHSGLKMEAYYRQLATNMKESGAEISETLIARRTAKQVNDMFGGQNWDRYLKLNPHVTSGLHLAFLAPDWSISNLKVAGRFGEALLYGVTGGRSEAIVSGLTRGRASVKSLAGTRKQAVLYGLRTAAMFYLGQEFVQYAFLKMNGQKPHSMAENDPEHEFDIELGTRDSQDRKEYIKILKQAREVVRYFSNPTEIVGNKMSPVARQVMEQFTGHSPGGMFATDWVGMDFYESLPKRITHIADGLVPLSFGKNNFAFFLPKSTGMNNYKTTKLFVETLRAWSEDAVQIKKGFRSFKDTEVQDQLERIIKASNENNLDTKQLLSSSISRLRTEYYSKLLEALNDNDKTDQNYYAKALARLGADDKSIDRALKYRYTKAIRTNTMEGLTVDKAVKQIDAAKRAVKSQSGEEKLITDTREEINKEQEKLFPTNAGRRRRPKRSRSRR